MIVFKNYFRIVKSLLPIIIVYSVIFIGVATIFSLSSSSQDVSDFQSKKTKIAVINHDSESVLMTSFQEYIKKESTYVELDEKEIRDALFFERVDYVMVIPSGFANDFINGKDVKIETYDVPSSYTSTLSKMLMNKYLNTTKLYINSGVSETKISEYVENDLNVHADVQMINTNVEANAMAKSAYYYNIANYVLISLLITIVAMGLISFRNQMIERRNMVSLTSYKSFNRQLLMGSIVVCLAIWLVYVIMSLILYTDEMLSMQGALLILNSFVLIIPIIIFGFLLSILTHNRELVSGISAVLGLGLSFIAGAFVPQELLSDFVISIAKMTPSYWYISNNNMIASMNDYSWTSLQPLFTNIAIILVFALVFYICIQVISRLKLKRS